MSEMKREMIIKEADVQLQEVGFGEINYPPGGTHGPRYQTNLQLVFVHSGQMKAFIDDKGFLVGANHAMLLLPGHVEQFRFAQSQETMHSWVQGPIKPLMDPVRHYITRLPRPIILSPILRNLAWFISEPTYLNNDR
jgi:hypothetical protein